MNGAPLSVARDGGVAGAARGKAGRVDVVGVWLRAVGGADGRGICGGSGRGGGIDDGGRRGEAWLRVGDGWGCTFRRGDRFGFRCGGGILIDVGVSGGMRYCCFGGGDGGLCGCCAAGRGAARGDVAGLLPVTAGAREGGLFGERAFVEGGCKVDGRSEGFEPGDVRRCVVGGEEELVGFDAEADNVAALEVVGCDAGLGVLEGVGAWWGQGAGALEGEARAGGYDEGGALEFDLDAVPGAHWGPAKGIRVLGGGLEVGALELGLAHEVCSERQVAGVGGKGLAAFFDAGRDVYGAEVSDARGVGRWREG